MRLRATKLKRGLSLARWLVQLTRPWYEFGTAEAVLAAPFPPPMHRSMVLCGILGITMERRCGQYSLTECRCDLSVFNLRRSMCRPSKIDVSTFEDRRSMCQPSRIDDRCVNLRGSMIDVKL